MLFGFPDPEADPRLLLVLPYSASALFGALTKVAPLAPPVRACNMALTSVICAAFLLVPIIAPEVSAR